MEWIALFFVGWLASLFTDRNSPPKTSTALQHEDDESAKIDDEKRRERAIRVRALKQELRKLNSPSPSEPTPKDDSSSGDRSNFTANGSEALLEQIPAVEQQQTTLVVQQARIRCEIEHEIAEESIAEPKNAPPSVTRNGIQELIAARGIRHVVHFTRIENLASILTRGLLSKSELHEKGLNSLINDHYRYDDHPEAVCCSLSFPNYRMFYRVRCEQPDSDWAVIRLKPQILWEKHCLFCAENAASLSISSMPTSTWEGIQGLRKMFANHKEMPTRDALRIPEHYTTNPQAEVLALESIEPDNIIDVCFDSNDRIKNLRAINKIIEPFRGKFKFHQNRSLFAPRKDYESWR